jgi:hypothetical protein
MITRAQKEEMLRIANLQKFTQEDAKTMESLIRMFHPTYEVCTHCVAQIKWGQQQLINYVNMQQVVEDVTEQMLEEGKPLVETEEPLLNFDPVEPTVDIVEADRVGCAKCKRARKNKS